MARQRFSSPVIQLPAVPPEMEPFRNAVQLLLTQLVTPGVIRAHEIDLISPPRGGTAGGSYLPPYAVYVDENDFLRAVKAGEKWIMPTELVLRGGTVTAS